MQASNQLTLYKSFLNRLPDKAPQFRVGLSSLLGVLLIVAGLVLTSSYFSSAASSSKAKKLVSNQHDVQRVVARNSKSLALLKTNKAGLSVANLAPLPPTNPTVATYDGTCTTPKTTFVLGDTVCARVTGAANLRVAWADTLNLIRNYDSIGVSGNQDVTFTLPATQTSTIANGELTVDNRGPWSAVVVENDGASDVVAPFIVRDPSAAAADLEITTDQIEGDIAVPDAILKYEVSVINRGPDSAANARFTSTTPSNTTFQQLDQESGSPTFTCTTPAVNNAGDINCSIASLAQGVRATFVIQFKVNSTVGGNAQVGTTASATSDTTDVYPDSNNSRADTSTPGQGGSGCSLTCPSNITVTADTTGPNPVDPSGPDVPGAIVTFDSASITGSCGTLTATPASGSFFPVGSTDVSVISSENGGECSFTVTVTEGGGAVSISCPSNKTANADANCSAIVSLGTPTTTGDNVTVSVSRSDGLAMYDCDSNGQNCVRKSQDLPFPAGVTTVTWTATNSSGTQSCTQTVTVVDVTPPVITVTNQTASADASCQAAVPDFSTIALVTDNCACASSDTSQICDSRQDIFVTQDVAPGTMVGLGPHTIHLTANDQSDNNNGAGNSTTVTVTFTVVDTTPPTITAPGPVTAYTGPGATSCDTVISDATLGSPTTADNCGPITVTRSPSGNTFPVGTTTVTWTATDGAGNSTSATQTVTVIDNTPPVINLNGNTPSLWPPNHKYQTFTVGNFVSSVFDNCGGVNVSDVVIDHVTSDEAENGNGDGNTSNDIVIGSDCKSVQLRSERVGSGDGRVYTITFRLTDTHGNTTTATANVTVAHNPGEAVVNSGVHYTVNGSCP